MAGVALTAVTGCGPLLRMVVTGDGPGVAVWAAGAMFIPSLALALGTVSRTHRTFQVAYLILWYAAVNQVAAVDYLGVVLVDGRPAVRSDRWSLPGHARYRPHGAGRPPRSPLTPDTPVPCARPRGRWWGRLVI